MSTLFDNFATLHCLRMQVLYLQLSELSGTEGRALIVQYALELLVPEAPNLSIETKLFNIQQFKSIVQQTLQKGQFQSAALIEHLLFFCRTIDIITFVQEAAMKQPQFVAILEPLAHNMVEIPWAAAGIAEQWVIGLDNAHREFPELGSLAEFSEIVNAFYGDTYNILKKLLPKQRSLLKRFRKQQEESTALSIAFMSQEEKHRRLNAPKSRPTHY